VVFILSATITGLAGALLAFHHRFASADPTSVAFSGEMLAIVVIGGMHSLLGPVIGAFFYILFREFLSIWTPNWLLYFGLLFVGFIIFSPNGLVGVWSRIAQRWNPLPETDAAMSARKIYQGLPFPTFLQPHTQDTTALQVSGLAKSFGGVQAVKNCGLSLAKGIHALIGPNGSGKTTTFNLISGLFTPDKGKVRLYGQNIQGMSAHDISMQGLARSFQITNLFKGLTIYENLRLSLQARHPGRYNMWRDVDSYVSVQTQTTELVRYLGLEGIDTVPAGSMSYGGQRLVDMGIALGCHPRVLLLDEPLAGLAAAERERSNHSTPYSRVDRRTRSRPRIGHLTRSYGDE
jgi:ABC-type branched-subunit amino acid transport system ATPase component